MDIAYPLLAALIVMLVSLSGILFSSRLLGGWMHRNLTYLATFSGGVFLLVVYHLLEETLHESSSLALAAGAVLFGAALMQALHHLLPDAHEHHGEHDHAHTRIDGKRVLLSDAFHNIGDGVLLVAAFATDWAIGIAAAIGIVLHELVQEVSEFFVLKESGYSNARALSLNFVSSSTILIGVGIAAFLASADHITVLFAGIAAGGFLTVLLQDLIPHAAHSIRAGSAWWKHALAALLGVALMFLVQAFLPHEEHGHEDEQAETTTASLQIPSTQS